MARIALLATLVFCLQLAAAVNLFVERRCAADFAGLLDLNPALGRYTIVMETPRMYLAYPTEQGSERIYGFDKKTGEPLGWVGMTPLPGNRYHLPIYFTDARGRGLGTEAKYAAMRWAFEVRGAESLVAYVAGDNAPSRALHRKLGFKELETDSRGIILYGIERRDFPKVREAFAPENGPSFLPRKQSLVTITTRVSRSPREMVSLYRRFRDDLASRIKEHPMLGALLTIAPLERMKMLGEFQASLTEQTQALDRKRAEKLQGATTRSQRDAVEREYQLAKAALEEPLAIGLMWAHLSAAGLEARFAEPQVDRLLDELGRIETEGLSIGGKTGTRRLARELLGRIKQSGLVQKATRLELAN